MTDLSLSKVYNCYDWCAAAQNDSDRVKLIQAVFNRVMENNAFRAADGEEPMTYDAIEQVMKDILVGNAITNFSVESSLLQITFLDNGLSAEVPQAARPGH